MGRFQVRSVDGPYNLHLAEPTENILAYVALNANHSIRRDTLTDHLWPDRPEASARALLNTGLWRINKAIMANDIPGLAIESDGRFLRFRTSADVFVDVVRLETAAIEARTLLTGRESHGLPEEIVRRLADAVAATNEEPLDGFRSHWALVERERLFNLQIRSLTLLMNHYAEAARYDEALDFGRRILTFDPMREHVQRQVMWLYVQNGQQARALRQFRDCADLLKTELGIAPMPETVALYDHIISRAVATPARPQGAWSAARTDEVEGLRDLFARLGAERRAVFSALAEPGRL